MLTIKLLVLVSYLNCVWCYNRYCNICANHTMCKYPISGPSTNCKGYENVLLNNNDITQIINRINDKRNFIATGNSRYFPQAANMNKIRWSEELANSAQRWADQCDPSIRPDREDECRDLEKMKVGQNIASIIGASNSVNVKNFIDIWFMQSASYTGSVTYYNMSQSSNSRYFTQMIWASTNKVGCGRARFHNNFHSVDRLVCNFSPKGNIQKRPIYTIGIPSTQCAEGMVSDYHFPALCTEVIEDVDLKPSTSLLRIIYSVTREIDPIRNNIYEIKNNVTQSHKSSKLRHVYNNSFALKRDSHNFWDSTLQNQSKYNEGFFQHKERGHSRVYHGHDHTHQLDYLHPNQNAQNFRRYDYSMTTSDEYSNVFRRINNQQCTRKSETSCFDSVTQGCENNISPTKQCTRGQRNICNPIEQSRQSVSLPFCENTQPQCPCNILKTTCATNPSNCIQNNNNNCQCSYLHYPLNLCPNMKRNLIENIRKEEITNLPLYDDLHLNEKYSSSSMETPKQPFLQFRDDFWILNNRNSKQEPLHIIKQLHDFRRRRETEESITFKPFWQVEEFSKQNQLKSLRYTTLSNKKSRRRKPQATQKLKQVTEPITIAMTSNVKYHTEKYLSFDELLRLRKLNASEYNARRSDDATTVATSTEAESSTTEYTANTPFVRLKHCTRKLTCTWTAASADGSEGNADINNRGSRTPPGYVEGCTRTSTCTRDFMNRNKMDTLPTPSTEEEDDDSNDGDYCEKRALNVPRKDSNEEAVSTKQPEINSKIKRNGIENVDDDDASECSCDDYLRNKRENDPISGEKLILKREAESYNSLSYGDLFYLVLRKIMDKWNANKIAIHGKCLCNSGNKNRFNIGSTIILIIVFFLFKI